MTCKWNDADEAGACALPPSDCAASPASRRRRKGNRPGILPVAACLVAVWALLSVPLLPDTLRRACSAIASEPIQNPQAEAQDTDHGARPNDRQPPPAAKVEERVLDYSERPSALRWLSHHQEDDGRWDCAKHGGDAHDVAVTALATLAFLTSRQTPEMGRYQNSVNKAVHWIDSQFGAETPGHYGPFRYEAALALIAMTQAYRMHGSRERPRDWHRNIQAAVDAAVAAQTPDGGWGYTPDATDGILTVSGWWFMALEAALHAKFDVPDRTIHRSGEFLRKTARKIPTAGQDAYVGTYKIGDARFCPASTAALMVGKQFLAYERDDPITIGAANALLHGLSDAEEGGMYAARFGRTEDDPMNQNIYIRHFQLIGYFQFGSGNEHWISFAPPLLEELETTQRTDGSDQEFRGSWDPKHVWHADAGNWGRVGQTATAGMTLQIVGFEISRQRFWEENRRRRAEEKAEEERAAKERQQTDTPADGQDEEPDPDIILDPPNAVDLAPQFEIVEEGGNEAVKGDPTGAGNLRAEPDVDIILDPEVVVGRAIGLEVDEEDWEEDWVEVWEEPMEGHPDEFDIFNDDLRGLPISGIDPLSSAAAGV